MSNELPPDIVEILELLAQMAKGYDNHLKWNEQARLKADLMNNRRYWLGFSPDAVQDKALALGMRPDDAGLIRDFVSRAQQGRRLVPDRSYRDAKFAHERPPGTDARAPGGGPFSGGPNADYPTLRNW